LIFLVLVEHIKQRYVSQVSSGIGAAHGLKAHESTKPAPIASG
jgi:hypothetical protein